MLIDDGAGRGFKAAVSAINMLKTCSVIRTADIYCNQVEGESYSVIIEQTPAGPDDCFCYIQNQSERDLIVSSVNVYVPTDEIISIRLGDSGAPVGGSDNTPGNRQAQCGNIAEAVVETGNDITGLDGGTEVEKIFIKGGESSKKIGWLSSFYIPKNQVLTMYTVNGSILVTMNLSMHFHSCPK